MVSRPQQNGQILINDNIDMLVISSRHNYHFQQLNLKLLSLRSLNTDKAVAHMQLTAAVGAGEALYRCVGIVHVTDTLFVLILLSLRWEL